MKLNKQFITDIKNTVRVPEMKVRTLQHFEWTREGNEIYQEAKVRITAPNYNTADFRVILQSPNSTTFQMEQI